MNYFSKNDSRNPLFNNPSELQKIFIKRRSFRKYKKGELNNDIFDAIKCSVLLFQKKMGFSHSKIEIISDRQIFEKVIEAATSGIIGKINPWLRRTDASAIILAIIDTRNLSDERERLIRIAETSMSMQIAILRSTELGLATCWMAGINSREIEKTLNLSDNQEIIAISTLGYPPEGSGFTDYDFWANRIVSGKRRSVEELYFIDKIVEE